jgi:hypothetical protein
MPSRSACHFSPSEPMRIEACWNLYIKDCHNQKHQPSNRYNNQQSSQKRQPQLPRNRRNPPPTQDNQDLPQITGVQIQRVEDRFIAKGKVYDKKEMLKAAGFKWDGTNKNWFKDATAAMH